MRFLVAAQCVREVSEERISRYDAQRLQTAACCGKAQASQRSQCTKRCATAPLALCATVVEFSDTLRQLEGEKVGSEGKSTRRPVQSRDIREPGKEVHCVDGQGRDRLSRCKIPRATDERSKAEAGACAPYEAQDQDKQVGVKQGPVMLCCGGSGTPPCRCGRLSFLGRPRGCAEGKGCGWRCGRRCVASSSRCGGSIRGECEGCGLMCGWEGE